MVDLIDLLNDERWEIFKKANITALFVFHFENKSVDFILHSMLTFLLGHF